MNHCGIYKIGGARVFLTSEPAIQSDSGSDTSVTKKWGQGDLNTRHLDLQSSALPD